MSHCHKPQAGMREELVTPPDAELCKCGHARRVHGPRLISQSAAATYHLVGAGKCHASVPLPGAWPFPRSKSCPCAEFTPEGKAWEVEKPGEWDDCPRCAKAMQAAFAAIARTEHWVIVKAVWRGRALSIGGTPVDPADPATTIGPKRGQHVQMAIEAPLSEWEPGLVYTICMIAEALRALGVTISFQLGEEGS